MGNISRKECGEPKKRTVSYGDTEPLAHISNQGTDAIICVSTGSILSLSFFGTSGPRRDVTQAGMCKLCCNRKY